jgi:probable rRNA maturation factor
VTASPAASEVLVEADDRQRCDGVDLGRLSELLAAVLADQHGTALAEVGLTLVDIDEMTALNETHMGGTGPTDVLAFPIDGVPGSASVPVGQPAMLGDIVICPEVAARAPQALQDELALLVVHGALHLLGHDHAEPAETARMQQLERDLLDRFHGRTP